MKPARIQPLSQTYHQLSRLLYETLLSFYTIQSKHDKKAAVDKAGFVLSLYEHHIAKEEALLFGFLHEYEPCVGAVLLDDYQIITKQAGNLRKMMEAGEQPGQGHEPLLHRFNEFLNTCLTQMKEHQSLINPVLWRYYSDEELVQMASAFILHTPAVTYQQHVAA